MSRHVHVALVEAQWLAGRDADLERDGVDAREHLGDRMLDLDPAVDLDEVELAGGIDEELERAEVLVTGSDGRSQRPLAQVGACRGAQRGRRALLEDLLVAPLDRAVALAEVHAVTEPVDGDLDLDVAVLLDPLLEVERLVVERGARLGAADLEHALELARRADHAHALAAAPGRWLDEDRVADPVGFVHRVAEVADHPVGARDRRQAETAEQATGRLLRREALEHLGRRTDEREVVRADDLGEPLVLGEEAVARVDRIAAGHDRGRDHGRAPRDSCAWRPPARCRRPRRRGARAGCRGRPRCTPPRPGCPGCGRRAGSGARSRRGWR